MFPLPALSGRASWREPRDIGKLTLRLASVHVEQGDWNREAMIEMSHDVSRDLLAATPRVINVGLEIFAVNLDSQDAKVTHVRWSPPAGGNSHLAGLLEKLQGR